VQQRTWQEAEDECCLRGGYLATFLDPFSDVLIIKYAAEQSKTMIEFYTSLIYIIRYRGYFPQQVWVGGMYSASEENIVWCEPGGGNVSYKSPLSRKVLNTFNILLFQFSNTGSDLVSILHLTAVFFYCFHI
jgi:hypothetical protein